MVRPVSFKGFQKGFQGVSLRGFRGFQFFLWELCVCIKYLSLGDPARGMSGIPIEAIYHIRTVRPACGRIYGQETSCLVPCSIARLTCMKDAEA